MHTPGPWELNDLSIESVSEGKFIACADSCMGNDLCEDLANARLIAAAPQMLEALEAVSTAMSHAVCVLNDDGSCDLCTTEAKVWAAIRKAKGVA